ncbi:hypothetical protein CYMTET_6752, partial [Cymbomonas tetramitiformis]
PQEAQADAHQEEAVEAQAQEEAEIQKRRMSCWTLDAHVAIECVLIWYRVIAKTVADSIFLEDELSNVPIVIIGWRTSRWAM